MTILASESYTDLMRSAPHWGFEITLEILSALIVYPVIRFAHKRLSDRLHRELDAEHGFTHTDTPGTAQRAAKSNVRLLPSTPAPGLDPNLTPAKRGHPFHADLYAQSKARHREDER